MNTGVLPVGAGEADAVMRGALVVIGTGGAEEEAAAVPAGTVLLAWKPAESVMPKPAAQSEGESPCWGVSWGRKRLDEHGVRRYEMSAGWGRVVICCDSERNVHRDSSSLGSDRSFLPDRRLEAGVSTR